MRRFAVTAVCLAASGAFAVDPGPNHAVIGTGGPQSVYETFGKALCASASSAGGPGCETRGVDTWQENLGGLEDGVFNFTFVASDRLKSAMDGEFEVPKAAELRAVLALPSTQVTILARPDRNIRVANDLRGRMVRTSPVQLLGPFLEWIGEGAWTEQDIGGFGPMGFENSVNGVCAGTFDAMIFQDGHPGDLTTIATKRCPLKLVPLADDIAQKLPLAYPEIVTTTIPAGLYPGQEGPVPSIGGYTVLLTMAGVPDSVVEKLVAALLTGYADVQTRHPSLAVWPMEKLRPRAFSVPVHPGADRALAAKGVIPR